MKPRKTINRPDVQKRSFFSWSVKTSQNFTHFLQLSDGFRCGVIALMMAKANCKLNNKLSSIKAFLRNLMRLHNNCLCRL